LGVFAVLVHLRGRWCRAADVVIVVVVAFISLKARRRDKAVRFAAAWNAAAGATATTTISSWRPINIDSCRNWNFSKRKEPEAQRRDIKDEAAQHELKSDQ
jgi:hypothetical protein